MDMLYGFWKGDKSAGANNKDKTSSDDSAGQTLSPSEDSGATKKESPSFDTNQGPGVETPKEENIVQSSNEEKRESLTLDEVSSGKSAQLQDGAHKAYESAKSIGSFLYSVAGKAGRSVSDTAKHLKHTVEENTILGEFNKEQEAFLKSKNSKEAGNPPWVGCMDEESLKQQILSLSQDKRNFVRSPPVGVQFNFNFDEMYPTAMAVLQEDKNLQTMRFELVPKMVTEENFWRNYFYRVSLVKQSNQLSSLTQDRGSSPDTDSRSSIDDESDESVKVKKGGVGVHDESPVESPSHAEFVSDTYGKSKVSVEDIKQGMKQLGVTSRGGEEEWEKELQHELQEYEVVTDTINSSSEVVEDADWENEIKEMLDSDPTSANSAKT